MVKGVAREEDNDQHRETEQQEIGSAAERFSHAHASSLMVASSCFAASPLSHLHAARWHSRWPETIRRARRHAAYTQRTLSGFIASSTGGWPAAART